MASDPPFEDVMNPFRAGAGAATRLVVERFTQRLIALARGRLDPGIRQKTDPDDVVQSVWLSFFRRQPEEQFTLKNWGALWGLLAQITVHKCCRLGEYHHAGVRDVSMEVSFHEAFDREPTPREAAYLPETLEHVMRGLNE